MQKVRAAWISDVHLGTRGASADALLDFLRDYDFETLYIVGDLIDIWALRRARYWPQNHNDVLQKILRKARKGTRVIYIPGNHDEMVADFCGSYGNIVVEKNCIHVTADGRRIFVFHGHELDTVVQNVRWLAVLGDVGYQFLLSLNPAINFFRRRFGLGYWSLSAYAKRRVKGCRQLYRPIRRGSRSLCGQLQSRRRALWSHPQRRHSKDQIDHLLQLRRLGRNLFRADRKGERRHRADSLRPASAARATRGGTRSGTDGSAHLWPRRCLPRATPGTRDALKEVEPRHTPVTQA